ncbi:MAG TPA: hypothetical protein VFG50_08245 [Rhodothermales bacterium]|nr:hypothetical protein [Rhodothermales bacterium]
MLKRVQIKKPEALPVPEPEVRLIETVKPVNRELDAGSATWAGVIAPLLGGLGYALEHVSDLEAVLRHLGIPEGTIATVLFGLGVLYAAVTRPKRKA